MIHRTRPLVLLAALLLAFSARAQAPTGAADARADQSKEAAILEFASDKVSFENDGTSVTEFTTRVRIQSDAGVKQYGLLTFSYQSATQTVDLAYVRVRKPDGSVIPTPQDNVQDLDAGITRDAPFYSDLREKHVAVKGLNAGDTLEYQIRWHTTKPLAPGQFWCTYEFEHDAIVLDEELQVSVPLGRAVKVKSPAIKPAITEAEGRRIYTWKTSNLENHSKDNEASKTLEANLGTLPQPAVQISTFQSWDEVGKWYAGLQQERVQPSADVRAKAAELAKGAPDEATVIHNVYDFVSTKFRYIGVAFGIGRYQPHAADDVLSNQFGDCKDKHTLFASLLKASGVAAYPALVSTSRELDPDVPSPAQFDHVISVVPQGQSYLWLDTTAEVGPFGYLVPQIRNKQALVIPDSKPAFLVTAPADLPFANTEAFTIDGKLNDDGTLESKMEIVSRGDSEFMLRAAFRQVPQARWNDLVQQVSYGLGFAGTVSDASASSPESTNAPFHFSYKYDRKDYPDWSSRKLTVPGLPFTLPEVSEQEEHAKDPIWLGPPLQMMSDSKVEVPKGYKPQLPGDVVIIRDYAEYRATYRTEGDVLVSHRELKVKLSMLPDADREDYKKFVKSLREDVDRYVVFNSASRLPAPTVNDPASAMLAAGLQTLPDTTNEEALKLEKDAFSAMGPDQDGATDMLKRAVAIDPNFTRGWIVLGSLYMTMLKTDAALDAFRKGIDSDPKQLVSYKILATAQMSARRSGDAVKTWQDLLKIEPKDPDAIRNLAQLLVIDKRFAEAAPLLETQAIQDPGSIQVKLQLGVAYLKSGQTDKGYESLQELLKSDSGPQTLNSVAYQLADANVKLPEALDYAQKAVNAEEEASQKTHLADITLENYRSATRIASFWDTLGWAHFRLGHLEEAEKYLRASWTLAQIPVVADHLGQLYELKQRRADAIHMYRLALRASTASLVRGDEAPIKAHLAHLDPSADTSAGTNLRGADAIGNELAEMRHVKLTRFYQGSASADFDLLFGPGAKLDEVKWIKGSEKLEGAEKALRSANFLFSFPEDSKAHIVRRGILSCSVYTGCSIILLTPEMVTTLN